LINSRLGGDSPLRYVGHDNFTAGYKTTSRLISEGRKRIIFFNSYPLISIPDERFAGYRKALEDAGIPFREELYFAEANPDECVNRVIESYERKNLSFDAIQCTNDGEAAYCGVELTQRGCKIPEDIFIAGGERFDDKHYPLFLWKFPMSSFQLDYQKMGETAARWILEGMNGSQLEPKSLQLPISMCEWKA